MQDSQHLAVKRCEVGGCPIRMHEEEEAPSNLHVTNPDSCSTPLKFGDCMCQTNVQVTMETAEGLVGLEMARRKDADKSSIQEVAGFKKSCPSVDVHGEQYSVCEVPPLNSELVTKSIQEVYCDVDPAEFARNVESMSGLICIAHDAALALEEGEITRSVHDTGYTITLKTEEAHISMHTMRTLAEDVVLDIHGAYVELYTSADSLVALSVLENVEKVAVQMRERAGCMSGSFLELAHSIKNISEVAQHAMARRRHELLESKKDAVNAQAVMSAASEAQKVLSMTVSETNAVLHEARAREWWSYQRCTWVSFLDDMTRVVQPILGVERPVRKAVAKCRRETLQAKTLVDRLAIDKLEALTRRNEATKDISRLFQKIRTSRTQADVAAVLIESLHQVISILKKLSVNMMRTATVWSQLEAHALRLACSGDVPRLLRVAMDKKSTHKEYDVFRSQALQRRALIYMARWIAIAEVGKEYSRNIHSARRALYKFLETESSYSQVAELLNSW